MEEASIMGVMQMPLLLTTYHVGVAFMNMQVCRHVREMQAAMGLEVPLRM